MRTMSASRMRNKDRSRRTWWRTTGERREQRTATVISHLVAVPHGADGAQHGAAAGLVGPRIGSRMPMPKSNPPTGSTRRTERHQDEPQTGRSIPNMCSRVLSSRCGPAVNRPGAAPTVAAGLAVAVPDSGGGPRHHPLDEPEPRSRGQVDEREADQREHEPGRVIGNAHVDRHPDQFRPDRRRIPDAGAPPRAASHLGEDPAYRVGQERERIAASEPHANQVAHLPCGRRPPR